MIWLSSAGRSLLRNKLRTIFTILSLIIGSASFFSMFLLSELAPRSIENSAKLLLGGDVLVQSYLKPLQSNIVNDIFQDMGEIDSHSSSYVGQSMVQSKNKTTSVILKGIDPKTYPYYGENQYPGIRSLQANEVLLADNAADRLQVKVGEKIWLPSASDGSLHEYKVKGLVLNVQESYGDADIFGAAYLTLNEAANLLNAPAGSTNEILIHWKAGTPKTSWQAELEKHLPSATLTDTKERTDESLAQAKTLLLLLQLFSLLALGISALTVSNTMKQAMSTRMRDIAVMKAIGVRSRSVAGTFLTEGILIGTIGTITGIVTGLLVSTWLTSYVGKMLAIPLSWEFSWKVTIVTFAVGMLMALISTWIPLKGMLIVSPMQLLLEGNHQIPSYRVRFWKRGLLLLLISLVVAFYLQKTLFLGSTESISSRVVLSFLGILLIIILVSIFVKVCSSAFSFIFRVVGSMRELISPRWFIPFHNLSSGRKRYGLLALILSVGVASAVSCELFADNLTQSVSQQLENEAKGNLLITSSLVESEAVKEAFQSLDIKKWTEGVQMNGLLSSINGSEATSLFQQKSDGNKFFASNKLSIEGVDPSLASRSYSIIGGRDLIEDDSSHKTALLLEDYQQLGIKTGDTVEVTMGEKKIPFKIVGFFESGFVKTVGMRTTKDILSKYGAPNRVMFSIDGGTRTTGLLSELNGLLPASAMAYSVLSTASESLNSMIRMISVFFSIVTLFAFITAILTIGNQIVISLLRKRREIAIIKAVGVSNGKTLRSILLENFVLSLVSGTAGTGIALLLTTVALKLMFKLPVLVDVKWVIYGIGLCVITTLSVAWIAARPALLTKPTQLLQTNQL
ncbi:FtsX-like permease family protein [Paenibacillus sp. FSL H8-0260]|jgi:putative ABC transport system permease protein|uniref:FtsX-like permease family protein n=1 Tax=Paenibacillus sp. FSL H8-0260 TaxID=2921380 RepID=UPI0032469AA5